MKRLFRLLVLIPVFLASCIKDPGLTYYTISGFTQGTTYTMTYAVKDSLNLKYAVDSILHDFDLSLSSWEENSVLSRLNRNETDSADQKVQTTFSVAKEVNEISGGAFDITVYPLVNAWGFGPGKKAEISPEVIDSILEFVGMSKVRIVDGRLIKDDPRISLDVNAIAQGYSVDVVAEYFESIGIENYLVEIGGEIRTLGLNPRHRTWEIGVDRPEFGNYFPGEDMQVVLALSGKSMASSGNYRKYYEEEGIKYWHSIDPVMGYPARGDVLSSTVIMNSCIEADAYATAIMILGLEKSKLMIEKVRGLEAYIIYGDEDGLFQVYYTDGFKPYIEREYYKTQ